MKNGLRYSLKSCYLLIGFFFFLLSSVKAQDPNANPNWDWRIGDNPSATYPGSEYTIYTSAPVIAANIKSPWSQDNAPDVLDDNKKEDGWVLVARDFGTPTRAIATTNTPGVAYFALYNRPRALMRVFILVLANQNFSTGSIILDFGNNVNKNTATLEHLYSRAYATDKIDAKQNKHASVLTNRVANGNWVWGDYPTAFDPTIVATSDPDCPRLHFQVIGTTETSIHLNGAATGIGGTYKDARNFLSGGSNGLGIVATSEAMPTTVGATMDFNTLKSKVFGTSNDWNSWKTALNDLYKNLDVHTGSDFLSVASNNLALAIGGIKDSWIVSNFPLIGAAVGLVDFLFGGGVTTSAKTGPTYFAFNLNLEGSAVTNYVIQTGATIPVAAAKSNPEVPSLGSSVPLLYNNPVGIFNLTKTPVLKVTWYTQGVVGGDTPGHWKPAERYMDFQVKDNLEYQINPASGLVLDSIRAWILMDPNANVDMSARYTDENLKLLGAWTIGATKDYGGIGNVPPPPAKIHLETSMNGKYSFASEPVDGKAFKYQRMVGPDGKLDPVTHVRTLGSTPDMTIKLKVVLHRADNPSAVPVMLVLTYEPDFDVTEYANGPKQWPMPPTPVITSVASGWNILSAPNASFNYVSQLTDFSKGYVFSGAISNAFGYNGTYVLRDPVENGAGYWLQYSTARDLTYYGTKLDALMINVKQGWNMIGSITTTFPTDKIKSYIVQNGADVETPSNVVSYYYGYNFGYQQSNAIEAGKGYWIKVAADGKLKLDAAVLTGMPPGITPDQPPQLPEAPPIPILASPVNGSTNQSLSPTVYWNASTGATSYRLQVSTNSGFSTLTYENSSLTTTSIQIPGLAYSTTYYWKVRAANDITSSNWSNIWWFTTQNPPPPPDPCAGIMSAQLMDAFTITDAAGNSQQMHTYNGGRALKLGKNDDEAPPEPIPGVFNVRFNSGKFIEAVPPTYALKNIPITIKDAKFPLTLTWNILPENRTEYWLMMSGSSARVKMKGSGSSQIKQSNGGVIIQA